MAAACNKVIQRLDGLNDNAGQLKVQDMARCLEETDHRATAYATKICVGLKLRQSGDVSIEIRVADPSDLRVADSSGNPDTAKSAELSLPRRQFSPPGSRETSEENAATFLNAGGISQCNRLFSKSGNFGLGDLYRAQVMSTVVVICVVPVARSVDYP